MVSGDNEEPKKDNIMISFDEFTILYNAAKGEPEFEICFMNQKNTYMIIKYDDHVSFQRCGVDDRSGEYDYPSLELLYKTESVDGIRLMDKWDSIETIIADGTYDLSIPEELDSFKAFRDIH